MKKFYIAFVGLVVSIAVTSNAQADDRVARNFRIVLVDQSELFVEPASAFFPALADDLGANLKISFRSIQRIQSLENRRLRIEFANDDRLTVRAPAAALTFKTVFGEVSIPLKYIREIEVIETDEIQDARPVSQSITDQEISDVPTIDYGGQFWELWRTQWRVIDDRLTAMGRVRPGYRYGHWASGRGAMAITGNADQRWQDYEFAFDFHMEPATSEFYHAHIPGETRGIAVFFRAKSLTESWNEPDTGYVLGINPNGTWGISAYEDFYCKGFGWSKNFGGKQEALVHGQAESPLNDSVNRLRVCAVGSTIAVWINEEIITEYEHSEGGKIEPIPYGGFGVRWRFESLGWISNVKVTHL